MHELGITRNIVAIVSERAQGQQVLRVTLEVGRLSGMFADAIRFCFDVCSKGTPLADATLEIIDASLSMQERAARFARLLVPALTGP